MQRTFRTFIKGFGIYFNIYPPETRTSTQKILLFNENFNKHINSFSIGSSFATTGHFLKSAITQGLTHEQKQQTEKH